MLTTSNVRVWKGIHTLEVFTLEPNSTGLIAGGILTSRSFDARYKIVMDQYWRIIKLTVRVIADPVRQLVLNRGDRGIWTDAQGIVLPQLEGCQEIDISATPFTNSIPIKKMTGLKEKSFLVAYINIPELSVTAVEQRYTKLAGEKYKYQNLSTGFSAELGFDQFGLINDYPGLFKTIYRKDPVSF
jgi:hypothetical protein